MRKRRRSVVAFIAILLCICTSVHATVLELKSLQLTRPALTTFFTYASNSGSMSLPSSMVVGATVSSLIGLPGNNGYTISGATFTISSSALDHDTSSGGLAGGEFNGGGTLTLTGTLKYNNVAITSPGTTLISANMAISSSETWSLGELSGTPIVISGSAQFLPDTTQGLGLGIVNGSDILKIGNFRVDFSFNNVNQNPDVFNTNQTLQGSANVIKFESMPEPATVFLFTMAALALRINKKK
jgi:hypothetical protein